MSITEETSQYHHIIWFAVDANWHVLVADSAEGSIPSFVREDEARTEQLARLLLGIPAISRNPELDFELLAAKGYICYRCDDYDGDTYRLVATPTYPSHIRNVSPDVQRLLLMQRVPFRGNKDFTLDDCECIAEELPEATEDILYPDDMDLRLP